MISYFSSKFHVWKYCKFKKLDIFRGLYFGSSLASCLLICILFFNHGLNLQVKVPSGRVVILLVCAVVLATPWILRVRRPRRIHFAAFFICLFYPTCFLWYKWLDIFVSTGFSIHFLLLLTATALSLGLAVASRVYLKFQHHRSSAKQTKDVRKQTAPFSMSQVKRIVSLFRRRHIDKLAARLRREIEALKHFPKMGIAASLALWAFLLAGILGLPHVYVPVHTTTATPIAAPKPISAVKGERTWIRNLTGRQIDVKAGSRGPIVLLQKRHSVELVGINGASGTTAWSYRRDKVKPGGNCEGEISRYRTISTIPCGIITSPNRRYAAFAVFAAQNSKEYDLASVVVVDTNTGAVVIERPYNGAQLTDHIAYIGKEGISLRDGSTLWENTTEASGQYWGSVGSSAFVTRFSCPNDRYKPTWPSKVCEVRMASDLHPSTTHAITNVLFFDSDTATPYIRNGWLVRRIDRDNKNNIRLKNSPHHDLEAVNVDNGAIVHLGNSARTLPPAISNIIVFYFEDKDSTPPRIVGLPEGKDLISSATFKEYEKNIVKSLYPTRDIFSVRWNDQQNNDAISPKIVLTRPGFTESVNVSVPLQLIRYSPDIGQESDRCLVAIPTPGSLVVPIPVNANYSYSNVISDRTILIGVR